MVVIDDWQFYAVAVPAVLLVGLSKSGVGAGFGALGVPLMALTVPVPQAAAIMLPLLGIMDLIGVRALWREADRPKLKLLVPAGLLGIVVGTLLFGVLPAQQVAGIVGAVTLAFVLVRTLRPPRADAPKPGPVAGFSLATVSGFTSFVAHAGGPPIGFYMLPQRMAPVPFTATFTGPPVAANDVPSTISTDAPALAAVVVGAAVVGATDVVSAADESGANDAVESSDEPPHAARTRTVAEISAVRMTR